jgi:beta-galactosidase
LPKDRYYLYQSKWSDKPVFHVLPHWTSELNQKFLVIPPSKALFVNGKSMGVRQKTNPHPYKVSFVDDVIYEPEIKVVAYDNDNKVVVIVICTGGQTYTLNLLPIEKKLNLTEKICRLLLLRFWTRRAIYAQSR